MTQPAEVYKVGVNVPEEFLERLMDAINGSMSPVYPKYDRTFSYWRVKGTWRPLEGADPYDGRIGEISVADEIRLEFAVRLEDLESVVSAIHRVHPYEEPAIDVIPMMPWKDLIPSDGT